MPVTQNILFTPQQGYPRFEIRRDGITAVRKVRIAWSDLNAFVAEIFPPTTVSGATIVINPGAPMPDYTFLTAQSMSVEPVVTKDATYSRTDAEAIDWEHADCTINYGIEDLDNTETDPVQFLQHNIEIGGEYLILPKEDLTWDDQTPVQVNKRIRAGKFIPQLEHNITWPRVPKPPFTAIRAAVGRVNNADIDFQTGKIKKETLLFLGASISRQVMSDGTRSWRLGYKFSERTVDAEDQTDPGGWNHFYRVHPGASGFYRLVRQSNPLQAKDGGYVEATAIYKQVDFNTLFKTDT